MKDQPENLSPSLVEAATKPRSWYYLQPDFSRPPLEIPQQDRVKISQRLRDLYPASEARRTYQELKRLLKVHHARKSDELIVQDKKCSANNRLTEEHAILITYGDLVLSPDQRPLATLAHVCRAYLKGTFNTLHILPFFPYSSDRGFAVKDFEQVDPKLGTWADILDLKCDFLLMFDGVFNHVSSQSRWFQEYLNGNPEYADFFTEFSTRAGISEDHLRLIVRPRTSDILTSFTTINGERLVWTTFSPDQIDLDYHNPKVLLKMIEILLMYVRRGADFIRLDAVTYLWEELGTSCVHLNQSHLIIKLFRDVLDLVAPRVVLITETNVPHEDNVRYFGDGRDEAQMVYNFALPPLVLHTFQTGNASKLAAWAATLQKVSDEATFLNFLDSHDGIGVMAVSGILSVEEIDLMALRVVEHGGFISYKKNGDGSESPYEFNITWYSAINREDANETTELQVQRYLASRAIALVFMGVPGIYLHGLLGSRNDAEAVLSEKQRRSINRRTIHLEELIRNLEDETTSTCLIFCKLVTMLKKRVSEKAFHPNAPQRILKAPATVFGLARESLDTREHIVSLINVTNSDQQVQVKLDPSRTSITNWRDLLTGEAFVAKDGVLTADLQPYRVFWLKGHKN